MVAAWCEQCRRRVFMVTVEEAMILSGAGSHEIFRLVEADAIHFSETAEGFVLICLNSLQSKESHAKKLIKQQPMRLISSREADAPQQLVEARV
jgi:hypothetical protein